MATLSVDTSGIDVMHKMLDSAPKDLKKACNAGGKVAAEKIKQEAKSTFTRNHDADHARGTTAANVKVKKASKRADGYAAYVTFNGTRSDGWKGTTRRNAEVAFVNEYGAPGKKPGGHPARPFIQNALDKYGDAIVKAMEDALPKY